VTDSRRPTPPTGLAAVRAAVRATSSGRLTGGRLVLVALFLGLPILIQFLVLTFGEGRGTAFPHFIEILQEGYWGFGLPLTLIFLSTAALGDEWEEGTAFYLLGLPLPRGAIVLGRWLVSIGRALAFVVPSVLLLYVLCLVSHEGALAHYLGELFWVLVGTILLGAGYGSVFLCIGLALRRPVLAAFIVYMFELFVSYLPRGFATLALSYHVRNLMWLKTGQEGFAAMSFQTGGIDVSTPAWQSLMSIALYVGIFLAFSTWLLRRKEFSGSVVPSDAGS
jgi:ABC-type transport system involved in multi-copper enzyme maturation permease subunit